MPAVQVRDFAEDVYEMIKAEAKASGRSITQQTKHIVVEHFKAEPGTQDMAAEALANADTMAGSTEVARSAYAFRSNGTEAQRQALIERRRQLLAKAESLDLPAWPQGLDPVAVVREARDAR